MFRKEEHKLMEPPVIKSDSGSLDVELTVSEGRISSSNFGFESRLYNGISPGPTIIVTAGDRVRITLINELSPDGSTYFQPNTTSLHLHGVHTSPGIEFHDNGFSRDVPKHK